MIMDAESGGSALSSPSEPTMSDGASPQERKIQDVKGIGPTFLEGWIVNKLTIKPCSLKF